MLLGYTGGGGALGRWFVLQLHEDPGSDPQPRQKRLGMLDFDTPVVETKKVPGAGLQHAFSGAWIPAHTYSHKIK